MSDADFDARFRQIRQCWQDATGITDTQESLGYLAPRLSRRAAGRRGNWRMKVLLTLAIITQVIAAIAILGTMPTLQDAWRAHEGQGTPGYFTSWARSCRHGTCSWYGEFFSRNGQLALYGYTYGPGGRPITRSSQTLPAVATGSTWMVYPIGGGTAWRAPAAGVAAATAIVLILLLAEIIVPLRRRKARRRKLNRLLLPGDFAGF